MNHKIEDYIQYCAKVNAMDKDEVVKLYGEKSALNMAYYTAEYAENKKQFILNQLKGWCDEKVWTEFESNIK